MCIQEVIYPFLNYKLQNWYFHMMIFIAFQPTRKINHTLNFLETHLSPWDQQQLPVQEEYVWYFFFFWSFIGHFEISPVGNCSFKTKFPMHFRLNLTVSYLHVTWLHTTGDCKRLFWLFHPVMKRYLKS